MKNRKQRLIMEQVNDKLIPYLDLQKVPKQPSGWINTIRTALNMSLSQLGKKTHKTAQGVRALEQREKSGAITLQSLREIADALDMQLIYVIIPKEGTLEDIVDKKANEKAIEIVQRTSASMSLEDQGNSNKRLLAARDQKRNELMNEMPKFLWD